MYWRKVHNCRRPAARRAGALIVNVLDLTGDEVVTACLPVRDLEENKYVFMVTEMGTVKKTELKAFSNPRATGIIALGLEKDDKLIEVQITSGEDNILIATYLGMSIRFPEKDVRPMGRTAAGVIGIRLEKGDRVIGVSIAGDDKTVLSVVENGYGKRTQVGEYRLQHRGGSGIINIKTTERNGNVVAMMTVDDSDDIVVVSTDGIVMRCSVKDIRAIGRNTQGVKVMMPSAGAKISAVGRAIPEEKGDEAADAAAPEGAPAGDTDAGEEEE